MIRQIVIPAVLALSWLSAGAYSVHGTVATPDGKPVAGVPVTDGDTIVLTDAKGVYHMDSSKRLGYLWYTVPAGYQPVTDGVFPQIHRYTQMPDSVDEQLDFTVLPAPDQTRYKVAFLGDMHLARMRKDLQQFREVMADFSAWKDSFPDTPVYAVTLGDMTWDKHWYKRRLKLDDYVKEMNRNVNGITIYHTIGNHDNDMRGTDNPSAKTPFRNIVAPNYYSFNIGKVHYVILDDIDCSEYDGSVSRKYSVNLVPEQLEWLRQDLKFVDPATPVVIASHAPVFAVDGLDNFRKSIRNTDVLLDILGDRNVHFVTGHTHKNYNVMPSHSVTDGHNVHEHNVAAVCSDWWYSGMLTPGCLVAPDGTPAGFSVWDVNGTELSDVYRPFFAGDHLQFRAYDLNNVSFTEADIPEVKDKEVMESFHRFCQAYPANLDNQVLINVWNYNPEWTISVTTEKGESLPTQHVLAYDPLHLEAATVKLYNKPIKKAPWIKTALYPHFFKVQCPDADTDLTITVSDNHGHTWSSVMHRPLPFTTDTYSLK